MWRITQKTDKDSSMGQVVEGASIQWVQIPLEGQESSFSQSVKPISFQAIQNWAPLHEPVPIALFEDYHIWGSSIETSTFSTLVLAHLKNGGKLEILEIR